MLFQVVPRPLHINILMGRKFGAHTIVGGSKRFDVFTQLTLKGVSKMSAFYTIQWYFSCACLQESRRFALNRSPIAVTWRISVCFPQNPITFVSVEIQDAIDHR